MDCEYCKALEEEIERLRALLREACEAVEDEEEKLRIIGDDGMWPNIKWLERARAAGGGE